MYSANYNLNAAQKVDVSWIACVYCQDTAYIRSLTISFFPLVQVQKAAKREKSNKSKKPGVDRQKAGLETPWFGGDFLSKTPHFSWILRGKAKKRPKAEK